MVGATGIEPVTPAV